MTLDELLTPENLGKHLCNPVIRRIIRDFVAALMESEFDREHYEIETTKSRPGVRQFICLAGCNYYDPRHSYAWPDWQRAADERMAK